MSEFSYPHTFASLTSGFSQAIILNPFDKAYFSHLKTRRPLMHPLNWKGPFQGMWNSAFTKLVGYGFYYQFIDIYTNITNHATTNEQLRNLAPCILTGTTTALFINPFIATKSYTWNQKAMNMQQIAKDMMIRAGPLSFGRGLPLTVARESGFSLIYNSLRVKYTKNKNDPFHFSLNVLFACLGTIVVHPFYYSRSKKYMTCYTQKSPTMYNLLKETTVGSPKQITKKIPYYMNRLGMGWWTLRVGIGMAMGQAIYDNIKFGILKN